MDLAARIDDYGKAGWIVLMVLGFVFVWPIGLAILAYLLWSGRMGCWKHRGPGRWHFSENADGDEGRRRKRRRGRRSPPSSGNRAFDEYREETLRRLEDEQEEFMTFLDRLRHAKDKMEFDQFMDERRRQASRPDAGGDGDKPEGPAPQPAA